MPELSQGQLNDPERKRTFGSNVTTTLLLLEKSVSSLSIRTAIDEKSIELIMDGRQSLTNEVIAAIANELYLTVNDLMQDYGSAIKQSEELRKKLKQLGKLPNQEQVADSKPAPRPIPVVRPDAKKGEDIAGGLKALGARGAAMLESPQVAALLSNTAETVAVDSIWNDEDSVANIDGRRFNLKDRHQRKQIATSIKALRDKHYPDDTNIIFFARVKTTRNVSWLGNLGQGNALIDGTDVDTFAEFFNVSVLTILTGEGIDPPAEVAADAVVIPALPETPIVAAAEETPPASGEVDLPAEAVAEEVVAEAVAEPAVVDSQPVVAHDAGEDQVVASAPTKAEPALSEAMQMHFKQLVLSGNIKPHEDNSWELLFRASHVENVDWCDIYLRMTDSGKEIFFGLNKLKVCLTEDNPALNAEITRRALSLALEG